MTSETTRNHPLRTVWVVLLAIGMALSLTVVQTSSAEARGGPPDHAQGQQECAGRSVPASKISIQLWTFNRVIRDVGVEAVLEALSDYGYRNIEPYSFHGLSAEEFKDLADEYGLKIRSRHMSTNEANWAGNLEVAKMLGQHWTGSGGFASPGIGSYENTLATAETLNRLGEASVKAGTGKVFGHNHASEFTTTYVDVEGDGTEKSAWQILVENTDPRWVTFQLDVGWAAIGGEDPVQLIEDFGDRIELLHIKDVVDPDGDWTQVTIGQGDLDWEAIFAAAQGKVRPGGYVVEQDPPVEPFSFAEDSFDYITCLTF